MLKCCSCPVFALALGPVVALAACTSLARGLAFSPMAVQCFPYVTNNKNGNNNNYNTNTYINNNTVENANHVIPSSNNSKHTNNKRTHAMRCTIKLQ